MSFDEDNNDNESEGGSGKPKTFFGMELGDGLVYVIVLVLSLIFIRQIMVVVQALN